MRLRSAASFHPLLRSQARLSTGNLHCFNPSVYRRRIQSHNVHTSGNMKRKAAELQTGPKAKRPREPEADYCDVSPQTDGNGNIIWPASLEAIKSARDFLKEW